MRTLWWDTEPRRGGGVRANPYDERAAIKELVVDGLRSGSPPTEEQFDDLAIALEGAGHDQAAEYVRIAKRLRDYDPAGTDDPTGPLYRLVDARVYFAGFADDWTGALEPMSDAAKGVWHARLWGEYISNETWDDVIDSLEADPWDVEGTPWPQGAVDALWADGAIADALGVEPEDVFPPSANIDVVGLDEAPSVIIDVEVQRFPGIPVWVTLLAAARGARALSIRPTVLELNHRHLVQVFEYLPETAGGGLARDTRSPVLWAVEVIDADGELCNTPARDRYAIDNQEWRLQDFDALELALIQAYRQGYSADDAADLIERTVA